MVKRSFLSIVFVALFLIPAVSFAAWVTSTIDSAGDVGYGASIAVDAGGKVHISYFDWTDYDLKYATNATGAWVTSTIDSAGVVGPDSSIAVDAGGKVHISYLDWTNDDLKYATNATDAWVTSTIDSAGLVGYCTSIAVDAGGKVHISYLDDGYYDLKYATNATGAWVTSTIDAGGLGYNTSIAVDAGGKVHISYSDWDNSALNYATNATGAWVTSAIDSTLGLSYPYSSIAVDTGGKVHISYYHSSSDYDESLGLNYATNVSGSWVTSTIDSPDVGLTTSIAVDTGGKVHISYYDYSNADLKYATNASGSWVTSTIDSAGEVGLTTSIAVDTGGKVHISYYDSTNGDLKYATNDNVKVCSDNVCVEFPNDTEPPDLTVTPSPDNPGLEDSGFQVIGPMYYDVSTDTPISGPIKVCINYDDTGLSLDQEQGLKIKHWDGSGWNDETCAPPPDNPNTDANVICACVDHLSWFAVGYEVSACAAEVCDGLDNDCDGQIDEGNPGGGAACQTGLPGICSAGTTQCQNGSLQCVQNQTPTAEVCNGLDDDCDGSTDEGVMTVFYQDADGDGYGNPSSTIQSCTQPARYVTNNIDCNDSNPLIHPGSGEVCGGVFYGFFNPVDNPPIVNVAKSSQTIPIKWRITDINGAPISNPASFKSLSSYSMSCNNLLGDPTDTIEEYVAGSSGLQYMGDGYWQFNWKTPKTYVGQCRTMVLTLSDGSMHDADFKFK